MEKVMFFNWKREIEEVKSYSINDDLILLDKPIITSFFDYPFKVDVTTAIIVIKGTMEGSFDLIPSKATAPCFIIILPGQILEYKSISEDFVGLFIVMSKRFTESLLHSAQERLPLFLSVRDRPSTPLNEEELEAMKSYFDMIKRAIITKKDDPFLIDIAKHLTLAFFYGANFHSQESEKKTHNELLVEKFLKLVESNYKKERGLEFYADKLSITPKHLSKIVKLNSNMSANEWIDSHVILEAKAFLKSANMTIQQISDELNFPSQSFFGKYFKRIVGLSPKEYRES